MRLRACLAPPAARARERAALAASPLAGGVLRLRTPGGGGGLRPAGRGYGGEVVRRPGSSVDGATHGGRATAGGGGAGSGRPAPLSGRARRRGPVSPLGGGGGRIPAGQRQI